MSGGIAQYRATSGEGTFPGQGGASKNRRSMAHKRDPLGAHEKQTRGLRGTPRSMSILWKRGRFLDRGAPRQHRGSVVHKEDPIGAHERAKGAKRDLQINVYIMGEWMFPGQGGASKNRGSMSHKRDPLGAHEREPRGVKRHPQINVNVMGDGMCFLGKGSPRIIEGQWPTRTSRDIQGG